MSETITKDPEWLMEQIEAGIEGYLNDEQERIIASIKGRIMDQIRDIMYLERSESYATEGATVSITFEVPDPVECARAIGMPTPANTAQNESK